MDKITITLTADESKKLFTALTVAGLALRSTSENRATLRDFMAKLKAADQKIETIEWIPANQE